MRSAVFLAGLVATLPDAVLGGKNRLIIDTDMLNFDDDPLAIGLANIFQSWDEVEVVGIMHSVSSRFASPGADAINTFFGHPDIPLAVPKPVNNLTQWPEFPQYGDYLTGLTNNFPEDLRDGANTPDPVTSYRYLLSTAADNSTTIAAIGFFDNLYGLLQSGPDAISPRTGAELLTTKVRELVVQAGEAGWSYNTAGAGRRHPDFAEAVLNWWPGKLTFASDDVGETTRLGARVTTELDPATNPLGYALRTNIGYNQTHWMWDVVAVYYAVCGLDDTFAWKYPQGGRVRLNGSAYATWEESAAGEAPGLQNTLAFQVPNTTFAARLEDTLLWEPGYAVPKDRTWCNTH